MAYSAADLQQNLDLISVTVVAMVQIDDSSFCGLAPRYGLTRLMGPSLNVFLFFGKVTNSKQSLLFRSDGKPGESTIWGTGRHMMLIYNTKIPTVGHCHQKSALTHRSGKANLQFCITVTTRDLGPCSWFRLVFVISLACCRNRSWSLPSLKAKNTSHVGKERVEMNSSICSKHTI